MKNKKLVYIFVLVILVTAVLLFWKLNADRNYSNVSSAEAVDEIEKYGYILYENKNEYYKEVFKELKELLNSENVDDKKYAEIIAELFVVDFYSLDDKISNTDVGGIDFIYPPAKDKFVLKATDTIYKYVKSNVYGDREQELPIVKEVKINKNEQTIFKSDSISDEKSYNITVDISYEKDLEYPTSVTLTLIHSGNKIYIVEVK